MSKETDAVVGVIGCAGLPFALVASFVLRAWALVQLWAWFITPQFHIASPHGAIALGISIFLGIAVPGDANVGSGGEKKSVASSVGATYGSLLLKYPIAVGTGWIVKHWI